MKKTLILLLAVALLTAGCLVTGNIVIQIDVGDFSLSPDETFGYEMVNLNDNPDYVEHKDDLNSIDDIGFVCKVHNTGGTTATGKLYISNTSQTSAVPNDKILVLDGISVAAGQTKTITLEESYNYLKNFEAARDAILKEQFTVYWTASGQFTLDVTDMVIVLSINGKP